jgi:hypothetical protein
MQGFLLRLSEIILILCLVLYGACEIVIQIANMNINHAQQTQEMKSK